MNRILFLLAFSFFSVHVFPQRGEGWTPIFDGKSLNGFKVLVGTAEYYVSNEAIVGKAVAGSANSFLVTEKEYGDFILEMDIMLQDSTINSGVQLRSHYDPTGNDQKGKVFGYQFELDPSSRKWFGGIYDEGRRGWLYPVSLNPSAQNGYMPGKFNKVRIECVGNIIQTFVNGIPTAAVVDDVDARGFIALQVHSIDEPGQAGKIIQWKNIRIKTAGLSLTPLPKDMFIVNLIPNSLSQPEKKSNWHLLFDGKTNAGWKGAYQATFPVKGWNIENGMISVLPSGGDESANGGDIVTTQQFHAFDFSFEFKMAKGANSGVKYFVTLTENNPGSALGLEYQVLDDEGHPDAKMGIAGNRTLASLYDLIPAVKQARFVKPIGEWNCARIVVYPNNHVEHYLNGIKTLEYERGSAEFRKLVAISKFKNRKDFGEAKKGYILLQDHGGAVSFRSLKIRELK